MRPRKRTTTSILRMLGLARKANIKRGEVVGGKIKAGKKPTGQTAVTVARLGSHRTIGVIDRGRRVKIRQTHHRRRSEIRRNYRRWDLSHSR
jgi:hypothetical protein